MSALTRGSSAASSNGSDLTRGLSSSTESGVPTFDVVDAGLDAPTAARVKLGWPERLLVTASCCLVAAGCSILIASRAFDSENHTPQLLWVVEVGFICAAVLMVAIITECCGVLTARRGSTRASDYATWMYCGVCTGVCGLLSRLVGQSVAIVAACILVQTGITGLLGIGIGSRSHIRNANIRTKEQRNVLLFANMVSSVYCALVSAAIVTGVMLVEHHKMRVMSVLIRLDVIAVIVTVASTASALATVRMLRFQGILSQLYGWLSGSLFIGASSYCIYTTYVMDTGVLNIDNAKPHLQLSVNCAAFVCCLTILEAVLWKHCKSSSWVVVLALAWVLIGFVALHFLWEAVAESKDLEGLVREHVSGFLYETGGCTNITTATQGSVESESLRYNCTISFQVSLLELVGTICLVVSISSFVRAGCLLLAHSIEARAKQAAHADAMLEQGRDSAMQEVQTELQLTQTARQEALSQANALSRTLQRTKIADHANHCVWEHAPGSQIYLQCKQLLESTWLKSDTYTFDSDAKVVVCEIENPTLQKRYDDYTAALNAPGEKLLFHGCATDVVVSISDKGFLAQFQTSSAGSWQRFGPGFYFALQSSKSHDYPLGEMKQMPIGAHRRSMLLCKVASGREFRTQVNRDNGEQNPPPGYDSVHGEATQGGPLNWDELVVYEEAAVLPYAIVEYGYWKNR